MGQYFGRGTRIVVWLTMSLAVTLLLGSCNGLGSGLLPNADSTAPSTTQVEPGAISSPENVLMCTPPACAPGEVLYCDGDCPGGCGTICVAPTLASEDVLMCSPPACAPGEVLFCDGDCPGGCGTICVAPTLAPENTIMCTPPACGPDEVYFCDGECPGGCGTICIDPSDPAQGSSNSGGGSPVVQPTDWDALADWLVGQWQDNANPAAVRAALLASGLQRDVNDWAAADFDGDLRDEWVVTLVDPAVTPGNGMTIPGNLWIINGNGVVYRTYEAIGEDPFEFGPPSIVGLGDMTGDGLLEVVTNVEVCGAHTCYGNFRVVGFAGDIYADLVNHEPTGEGDPGNTIVLSFPDIQLVDIDGNNQDDLLVHGGTIGSAGAGIVRPRTEIWSWDGTGIRLVDTQLDPTEYRHHVLYEANDLMAAGNNDQALMLYEAAINDGALRTQPFAASDADTYSAISRFAAFRLVLLDAILGQPDRAAGRLAWLQETYPDSAAMQAATLVVDSLAAGEPDLAAVCEQVEALVAELENPTGALVDMGYGNPSLTAADFCP